MIFFLSFHHPLNWADRPRHASGLSRVLKFFLRTFNKHSDAMGTLPLHTHTHTHTHTHSHICMFIQGTLQGEVSLYS
jgi:hypothetical protein